METSVAKGMQRAREMAKNVKNTFLSYIEDAKENERQIRKKGGKYFNVGKLYTVLVAIIFAINCPVFIL
jgi:hypothetical protein